MVTARVSCKHRAEHDFTFAEKADALQIVDEALRLMEQFGRDCLFEWNTDKGARSHVAQLSCRGEDMSCVVPAAGPVANDVKQLGVTLKCGNLNQESPVKIARQEA